MTVRSAPFTQESVALAGTNLHLLKGGEGRPALVLHGIEGPEGWLAFHDALSRKSAVYAPTHPGYGETERPPWLEAISHQAIFYNWFIQQAGLEDVDLIGFGIGGWIAAEMAVMCPHNFAHLVLVDAAGLHPREAQLLDIFVMPWREVIERSFSDAQASSEFQRIYTERPLSDFGGPREAGRSMSMRMCYRPYMFDPALQPLLGRIDIPTLIVWGADDQVIPLECGEMYRDAISGAALKVLDHAGHWPHYEQPQQLAELIQEFVLR